MASFSLAIQVGRWHAQIVATNDTGDDAEDTGYEPEVTHLGAASLTIAGYDRPHFGFSPSSPDQEPWWEEEGEE